MNESKSALEIDIFNSNDKIRCLNGAFQKGERSGEEAHLSSQAWQTRQTNPFSEFTAPSPISA